MKHVLKYTHPGLAAYVCHYIDNNDSRHRRDHIINVAVEAEKIAKAYSLCPKRMELASLLHDLYSGRSREDHHLKSSVWVRENLGAFGYSSAVVADVARMCQEHRASTSGQYSNPLCEAFSAADRGPLNIYASIDRSLGVYNSKVSADQYIKELTETIHMLRGKFCGTEGYARDNKIHSEMYSVDDFRKALLQPVGEIFEQWSERPAPEAYRPIAPALITPDDTVLHFEYFDEDEMFSVNFPLCSESQVRSHRYTRFNPKGTLII